MNNVAKLAEIIT